MPAVSPGDDLLIGDDGFLVSLVALATPVTAGQKAAFQLNVSVALDHLKWSLRNAYDLTEAEADDPLTGLPVTSPGFWGSRYAPFGASSLSILLTSGKDVLGGGLGNDILFGDSASVVTALAADSPGKLLTLYGASLDVSFLADCTPYSKNVLARGSTWGATDHDTLSGGGGSDRVVDAFSPLDSFAMATAAAAQQRTLNALQGILARVLPGPPAGRREDRSDRQALDVQSVSCGAPRRASQGHLGPAFCDFAAGETRGTHGPDAHATLACHDEDVANCRNGPGRFDPVLWRGAVRAGR